MKQQQLIHFGNWRSLFPGVCSRIQSFHFYFAASLLGHLPLPTTASTSWKASIFISVFRFMSLSHSTYTITLCMFVRHNECVITFQSVRLFVCRCLFVSIHCLVLASVVCTCYHASILM